MVSKKFAAIAFLFFGFCAPGNFAMAITPWQEGDLIKERISLAPRQKNALEKYDAPGTEKMTVAASQSQKERPENRVSSATRSKQNAPEEQNSANKPQVSRQASPSSNTPMLNPTPTTALGSPYGTTLPINTPIKESSLDSLWLNPGKVISRFFEFFVVLGAILLGAYLAMQKFRAASSE